MPTWVWSLLALALALVLVWAARYVVWALRLRGLAREAEPEGFRSRRFRFGLEPWLTLTSPHDRLTASVWPDRLFGRGRACTLAVMVDDVVVGPERLVLELEPAGRYLASSRRPLQPEDERLAARFTVSCESEEQEQPCLQLLRHPRIIDALLRLDPAVYTFSLRAPGGRAGWLSLQTVVPAPALVQLRPHLARVVELKAALEEATGRTGYR